MSRRQKKIEEKYHDIMRELYLKATPPGDWDKMLEEAPTMEDGRKFIDFKNYYLDNNQMCEIVDKHLKGMRKYNKRDLRFLIYLGASPTSYKE